MFKGKRGAHDRLKRILDAKDIPEAKNKEITLFCAKMAYGDTLLPDVGLRQALDYVAYLDLLPATKKRDEFLAVLRVMIINLYLVKDNINKAEDYYLRSLDSYQVDGQKDIQFAGAIMEKLSPNPARAYAFFQKLLARKPSPAKKEFYYAVGDGFSRFLLILSDAITLAPSDPNFPRAYALAAMESAAKLIREQIALKVDFNDALSRFCAICLKANQQNDNVIFPAKTQRLIFERLLIQLDNPIYFNTTSYFGVQSVLFTLYASAPDTYSEQLTKCATFLIKAAICPTEFKEEAQAYLYRQTDPIRFAEFMQARGSASALADLAVFKFEKFNEQDNPDPVAFQTMLDQTIQALETYLDAEEKLPERREDSKKAVKSRDEYVYTRALCLHLKITGAQSVSELDLSQAISPEESQKHAAEISLIQQLLKSLAKQSYPNTEFNLGLLYLHGTYGGEPNYDCAEEFLRPYQDDPDLLPFYTVAVHGQAAKAQTPAVAQELRARAYKLFSKVVANAEDPDSLESFNQMIAQVSDPRVAAAAAPAPAAAAAAPAAAHPKFFHRHFPLYVPGRAVKELQKLISRKNIPLPDLVLQITHLLHQSKGYFAKTATIFSELINLVKDAIDLQLPIEVRLQMLNCFSKWPLALAEPRYAQALHFFITNIRKDELDTPSRQYQFLYALANFSGFKGKLNADSFFINYSHGLLTTDLVNPAANMRELTHYFSALATIDAQVSKPQMVFGSDHESRIEKLFDLIQTRLDEANEIDISMLYHAYHYLSLKYPHLQTTISPDTSKRFQSYEQTLRAPSSVEESYTQMSVGEIMPSHFEREPFIGSRRVDYAYHTAAGIIAVQYHGKVHDVYLESGQRVAFRARDALCRATLEMTPGVARVVELPSEIADDPDRQRKVAQLIFPQGAPQAGVKQAAPSRTAPSAVVFAPPAAKPAKAANAAAPAAPDRRGPRSQPRKK